LLKKYFAVRKMCVSTDAAFLLLRLVVGYAFILHGSGKIQSPMSWMGEGAAMPGLLQALAAVSEFGGGIALMAGLLTRLASLGIACTMAVAVYTHAIAMGDPFVNMTGGRAYELAAVYFSIAVLFVTTGPGRLSVDRFVFGTK
jgi:putative oxidoreductase